MDKIKTNFTIADLENFTGISADTIRKWESRYGLLRPDRTRSNIRRYDVQNLKKLLSIAVLYRHGNKISDLASFTEKQLNAEVSELAARNQDFEHHIHSFLIATLGFNRHLFEECYSRLLAVMSFRDLFTKVIFPFLENIGTLWQSNTVTPAHEHFISNLIRQKLFNRIEAISYRVVSEKETFVLFLPLNEIHELGLLFLHYTLLSGGRNSIYLGAGLEASDLPEVKRNHPGHIIYITYMTVDPQHQKVEAYVNDFRKNILENNDRLWVAGSKTRELKNAASPQVLIFKSGKELAEHLEIHHPGVTVN